MTTWLCHQLGSREHYSIPRALERTGHLGLLQTDAWVLPDWAWLPKALRQGALAGRFHPELESAEIRAFTLGRVAFDLRAKISRKDTWTTISERDLWFQQKCLPHLQRSLQENQHPVVFSYAYTARKLFETARQHGAICVLGQVDPGPGELAHLKKVLPDEIAGQIEDRPERYWAAWREEVAMADRILVNSEWSSELLVEYSEVSEEKINIVPLAYEVGNSPSVLPDEFHEKRADGRNNGLRRYPERFTRERPLRILFLGQVIHRKGVHVLLEAMQRLAGQPVHLDLAGPIGMEVPESLSKSSDVTIHGAVQRNSALHLYQEADLFILPTFSDGFALTQLEAAAHGLPLIVSRYCGRVVDHEKNGLLLDEVSVDSIEAAILRCLQNPEQLLKWSAWSIDWQEYSLEKLGERLVLLVK